MMDEISINQITMDSYFQNFIRYMSSRTIQQSLIHQLSKNRTIIFFQLMPRDLGQSLWRPGLSLYLIRRRGIAGHIACLSFLTMEFFSPCLLNTYEVYLNEDIFPRYILFCIILPCYNTRLNIMLNLLEIFNWKATISNGSEKLVIDRHVC